MNIHEAIEFGKRHKGQKAIIEMSRNAYLKTLTAWHEGTSQDKSSFSVTVDHVIRAATASRILQHAGGEL